VSSAMTAQQANAPPRGGAGNRLLVPVPGLDVARAWQVGRVLFHPAGAARELIDAMRRSRRGLIAVSLRSAIPRSLTSA
jgi:hypothetical protein